MLFSYLYQRLGKYRWVFEKWIDNIILPIDNALTSSYPLLPSTLVIISWQLIQVYFLLAPLPILLLLLYKSA